MPSFTQRSYKKELLDSDAIPFAAIKQNMAELNTINQLLGGHRITLKGIKTLISTNTERHWNVVEIGCGGGDNLRVIKKWAAKRHIAITLTGIDINKECVAFAETVEGNKGIRFIVSDYRTMRFEESPHILFSSLFCHHFTDEELAAQLQWMYANSKAGFFINDLHRSPLAYYSIKVLTQLFSRSYLVKNDAPLSVLRGFKKRDWAIIFSKAGLTLIRCQWQWAFRWLVICFK